MITDLAPERSLLEMMEPIKRLTRDIKAMQSTLSPHEVRMLVDLYYMVQEDRKRATNQVAALTKSEEPHEILSWVLANAEILENDIKRVLDPWSLSHRAGRWARSIVGIGPVLASGLVAHIDITKAPTVGHVWRYAGLDPTVKWEKGQKRPWNAALKVITWKIGQSFMKFQNHDEDIYGKVYVARKAFEVARNERGENAETAAGALTAKKYGKETTSYQAYTEGRLPAAQIDARARRYCVKLFLSHFHYVAFESRYGEPPPKPYVISVMGHADFVSPPHWPMD